MLNDFFETCLEGMPARCVKKSVAFLLFWLCRIVGFSARLDGGVYAIKKEYRLVLLCDPFGARTQDPNIKSVVLYQLS